MGTRLLAVVGPTASGKTALAVELALRLGGEVVSCDSMQIYRDMPIATAVPSEAERRGVPHHMMEIAEPEESFSVAEYCRRAKQCIEEVTARGAVPILCGGTGLYYNSLADGIAFADIEEQPKLREELAARIEREGGEALLRELSEVDEPTAQRLSAADHKRIIRALEVYRVTGVPMSEHIRRSREQPSPFELSVVGLDYRERERLYERINRRVDIMLEQGLVQEAERFFERHSGKTASQAIGYKELRPAMEGRCSWEEAIESLKRETRRYAKRQLSWFRRDSRIKWIYADEETGPEAIVKRAVELINSEMKENG